MNEALPFDFQPTLVGETISLLPLKPEDLDALHAAASDPWIWEQHPESTRYRRQVFEDGYFAGAVDSGSAFVVTDHASGKIIGSSRYYDWDPEKKEVAIGYTFLARSHWGGATNREMKQLMLDHAFRWAKVVWFHIGSDNWRSRKAMEKLGGRLCPGESKILQGALHVYYRIDAPPEA